MNFIHSESTIKPLEFDDKLSKKGVYIRKNIVEVERKEEGPEGEEIIVKMYEYDEAYLTKAEYTSYNMSRSAIEDANTISNEEAIDNYTLQLLEQGIIK